MIYTYFSICCCIVVVGWGIDYYMLLCFSVGWVEVVEIGGHHCRVRLYLFSSGCLDRVVDSVEEDRLEVGVGSWWVSFYGMLKLDFG